MNKFLKNISFLLGISFMTHAVPAQAFFTIDVAEMGGRLSTVVGDALRKAQKDLDTKEQQIFGELIGEGNKETKQILPMIEGWKTEYADKVLSLGGNKDVYASSSMDSARLSQVETQIAKLLADKANISAESNEVYKIKQAEINGKIEAAEKNIAEAQKELAATPSDDFATGLELENYISENQELIEEYREELTALDKEYDVSAKLDDVQSMLDALNAEKNKLQEQIKKKLDNILKEAINLDDPSGGLSKAKEQNYTTKEVAENVKEIRKKRFIERRNAVTSSYAEAIQLKYRMYTEPDVFKDFTDTAENMETLGGQVGMDTQMKIKIIELLMQYANLMVNDLREYTAHEYGDRRFYTMRQPENDLINFNLDDYVMRDKEDI